MILVALVSAIPATIAAEKGRSFVGWWLFSFVLFIPALICAILIEPRRVRSPLPSLDEWNAVGHGEPAERGFVDEFRRLADLHDEGALTDGEFQAAKSKLLDNSRG